MTDDTERARIESMVIDFLVERFELPRERLTAGTGLRDLGLDSMIMLDVLLDVEDRLGVKMRDLAMPPNPKISDITALVARNLAAR
ncbi:MAG: acyl carrier protein [Proteobacteria bacterium]|nr:acyl carrier protein [Pseudomonadota bacterium]